MFLTGRGKAGGKKLSLGERFAWNKVNKCTHKPQKAKLIFIPVLEKEMTSYTSCTGSATFLFSKLVLKEQCHFDIVGCHL